MVATCYEFPQRREPFGEMIKQIRSDPDAPALRFCRDTARNNPLHQAARLGDAALCWSLAAEDPGMLDATNAEGFTPLHLAVYCALTVDRAAGGAMAAVLLSAGADPESLNRVGQTPMMMAAASGDARLVNTFLRHGAPAWSLQKVEAGGRPDLNNRASPLHYAMRNLKSGVGMPEVCKKLLDAGAPATAQTGFGRTPLHFLAERAGVIMSDRIPHEKTCASIRKTVALLVEHGADVNARDVVNGHTPLHLLARKPGAWRGARVLAQALIRHGADPEAVDDNGYTPAELAAKNDDGEFARLLEMLRRGRKPPPAPEAGAELSA